MTAPVVEPCRGALGTQLKDLLSGGPIRWLLISNFMIDMRWFVSAAPSVLDADRVTVVHGEKSNPTRWILIHTPLACHLLE